jgi:hypothetical protein
MPHIARQVNYHIIFSDFLAADWTHLYHLKEVHSLHFQITSSKQTHCCSLRLCTLLVVNRKLHQGELVDDPRRWYSLLLGSESNIAKICIVYEKVVKTGEARDAQKTEEARKRQDHIEDTVACAAGVIS